MSAAHTRPNWSRALPRSLVIPDVMTIATLADARALMRHLPAGHAESGRRGATSPRRSPRLPAAPISPMLLSPCGWR